VNVVVKLDKIDKAILQSLQKSGRITNVDLAKAVGISAPPCLRRLKFMERNGIIAGYHAELNYDILGYNLRAICVVSLLSQSSREVSSFVDRLLRSRNIKFCFSTPGNESFVLFIIAKDLSDYEKTLKENIQSNDHIANVRTYILANKHAEKHELPF
jgi:DNA-binding Lrp family transcriptional regulator